MAVGVDGADDVDGVEDAGEVTEDGEQDADPELQGAAAVAEADAEGREQDGAQELQAPAAARTQAHLVPLLFLLGSSRAALLGRFGNKGKGNGWIFLPVERKELEIQHGTTRRHYRLQSQPIM